MARKLLALRLFLLDVRRHVRLEGAASREALAADVADEGLLASMRTPVQSCEDRARTQPGSCTRTGAGEDCS